MTTVTQVAVKVKQQLKLAFYRLRIPERKIFTRYLVLTVPKSFYSQKQRFLCLRSGLQPSLFINLQMVFFPPTWPFLANCVKAVWSSFPFCT